MTKHEAELKQLREALQEADTLMGHDDAESEWRERWACLWADDATPAAPDGRKDNDDG